MADLHNVFLKFDSALSLTSKRKAKLIASRKAVEDSIIKHFKANSKLPVPKFYIQGSYKMGTIILKKDNTYDVDLGVYFFNKPDITSKALQQNVVRAVKQQTEIGAQHKEKCVRVIYKGEFNIDLPVYYFPKQDKNPVPLLATKTTWEKSDPKELVDWFEKKKDKDGQLIRVVKYIKAWANARSFKMPSGIALSVWAAYNYKKSTQDDVALLQTLKEIKSSFFLGIVECKNPATPKDDLVAKLDSNQKRKFKDALKQIIADGERAISEKDKLKAYNLWRQHLGTRFLNL